MIQVRSLCLCRCLVILTLILLQTGPAAAVADASKELWALFADYDEWYHASFPEEAMAKGDNRYAHMVADLSMQAIEQRHADRVQFRNRAVQIDREALSEEDQLNVDLFIAKLSDEIDGHASRAFLMPVGGWFGFETRLTGMATGLRLRTQDDFQNYLTRLGRVPVMVQQVIERMKVGVREGRTRPRVTLAGIPERIASLLSDNGLAMLRAPLENMPGHIPAEVQQAMLEQYDAQVLPAVRASLRTLHQYLVESYIPAARTTIAAIDYPDGDAYYNQQIREMTTLNLTAREVHEIGLAEVARIRDEMFDVIRSSDFMQIHEDAETMSDDALFDAFVYYLRSDPRFYHESAEALLNGYKIICKDIDALMPELFRTLPRLSYGVREIPRFMAPTMTTAYYDSGNLATGKAGYFFANTYKLDQRPKYEMIALTLHEAVPGHHHQVAIAQELENVPEFRKDLWFTAYGEGWALYAEKIGIDMGLYRTPYDHFGRLLYEMWRACRLVVDTGMHAFGWARDEAIAYMKRNTALSELNIANEVDRYIGWPAQALGYKLGEITISRLRSEAERELGGRFDIREFHDEVLLCGSVPLSILEKRIHEWIEMTRSAGDD